LPQFGQADGIVSLLLGFGLARVEPQKLQTIFCLEGSGSPGNLYGLIGLRGCN